MIADYPLIPETAFKYFPQRNQLREQRNGKMQRIIFGGGIEFTKQQNQKIEVLKKQIRDSYFNSDLDGFSDDFLLRFLQSASFDNADCIKTLGEYNEWQKTMLPLQMSKNTLKLLTKGLLYCPGRDNKFRPIVIVNIKAILNLDLKEPQLLEMLGFFYQYLIENMLIEGQIENWVTVIDLGYCGVFSVGGALMNIIKHLSNIFKARSHHSYIISCPGTIKFLWKMVKGVLNQDQLRKITLSQKQRLKPEVFASTIQPSQIQIKYGGSMPNLTEFWPIKPNPNLCISRDFTASNLISENQYNHLFEKGTLRDRKIKKTFINKFKEPSEKMDDQISEDDKMTEKDEKEVHQNIQDFFPNEEKPQQINFAFEKHLCYFSLVATHQKINK